MTKAYGLIEYKYLFSTYSEYKKKKDLIIDKFLDTSLANKLLYKMYIYSRPILTERQKELVWKELNKKSELFDTTEEYTKKRLIIGKLYSKWNKQEIVIYRAYLFSKTIPEKRKIEMWEEINAYSKMYGGIYEGSS